MARVKCVMMQRDEQLLLEPWMLYHGYLFGFENLTVFDNGSVLPDVAALLARFEAAGVTVIRQFPQVDDWLRKGEYFERVIQGWDLGGDYDFAIPLDCDEFLSLFTEDGLTCKQGAILDYLDSLVGRPEVLAIDTTNFNVPGRAGWFWPGFGSKRFFSANTIGTLDHGFHTATSRKSDAVLPTRLTHLHFHHKPHAVVLEHARRKLHRFVDVEDRTALLSFDGPCSHLVRHFCQTEAEYLDQFENFMTFGFTDLSATLSALGHKSSMFTSPQTPTQSKYVTIRRPANNSGAADIVVFDPKAYLRTHIDVAAVDTYPIQHFLYHGFSEGRIIQDVRSSFLEVPLGWAERD